MTVHYRGHGDPSGAVVHVHDFGDNGDRPTGDTTTGAVGQCRCGRWGVKRLVVDRPGHQSWDWKPISRRRAHRLLRRAGVEP